jgi:hypothetical protein
MFSFDARDRGKGAVATWRRWEEEEGEDEDQESGVSAWEEMVWRMKRQEDAPPR